MKVRTPPSTASITTDVDENGKLNAPSAARNANDVFAAISAIAPHSGVALEIASGTGNTSLRLRLPCRIFSGNQQKWSRYVSVVFRLMFTKQLKGILRNQSC